MGGNLNPAIAQQAANTMSDPVNQQMAIEDLAGGPVPSRIAPPGMPQAPQVPAAGGAPPSMPTGGGGADSLAAPDMAQEIARHQVIAGKLNPGGSREWAENAVAGVQAALAGFGAGGKVPPGAGALYGVGAAARQAGAAHQEMAKEKNQQNDRKEQLDIEKQRADQEATNEDREYKLRLAENARQQATQAKAFALDDANLKLANSRDAREADAATDRHIEFLQHQTDYLDKLSSVGGGPAKVNGSTSPEFAHHGELEEWAKANGIVLNAHENGYIHRPVMLPNGKSQIWDQPDTGPTWHTVKDADGHDQRIFADPLTVMSAQKIVADTREINAKVGLTNAQAQRDLKKANDSETAKGAREALDAATDDEGVIHLDKMKPGQVQQIRKATLDQYSKATDALRTAQTEMRNDADYFDATDDPEKMKELESKYGVDEASQSRNQARDTIRQLDGYKNPGGGAAGGAMPQAPTKGAALTPEIRDKFLAAAGGDPEKAKQLAIKSGWGPMAAPPQTQQQATAAAAQLGAGGYGEGTARSIR
jgi:hypothetical protein